MSPYEIPGLMPIPKIQPKKTKGKPITQACVTLSAVKLLEKVKKIDRKEEEKNQHTQGRGCCDKGKIKRSLPEMEIGVLI